MQTLSDEGLQNRRIILLRLLNEKDPEVLLDMEGTQHTLPQVRITRSQRIAEQLTAAFKESCSMDTVSLSALEALPLRSHTEHSSYEIMETHRSLEQAPHGKRWVSVNSLVESGFRDRTDFQAVRQAVVQSIISGVGTSRGPFAHLGWFHQLEQWVEHEIRPHGFHLSGTFRQLNACATFSLIRFETQGSAVWFKAVGAPNAREYALTMALARSFSRFLPQVLATRPECNGWLSLEAEGPLLHESSAFSSWEMVARDLARLQIHSLDKCVHLLDLGARDLRTSALADLVEPFLQAMGEVMERQAKTPPQRLSREQLHILAGRVQDALRSLEATELPEALGHMDLNPGNIICAADGSVFLDWAEAFVGHPFLTFGYLVEHCRRTFGQERLQEIQLVANYSLQWRAFVSGDQIHRALNISPLVAVFAYAVGNEAWRNPRKLHEPRAAGYLRSLTRRMDREAHTLAERRASCPD